MIEMFANLEKLENNIVEREAEFNISFHNGARVDVIGHTNKSYRVEFWYNDVCEFTTVLKTGFFASPIKRYYVPWHVKIYSGEKLIAEKKLELQNKKVFVMIDSTSIGDTIAWVPQAIEFSRKHSCELILCTFHNELFADEKGVEFIGPGTPIGDCEASYTIGYFMNEDLYNYTPVDPRNSPLVKVASDILGMRYEELLPNMNYTISTRPIEERYVCIATRSTANAKHWHRENGWQDVIDYLNLIGYKVMLIQKEEHNLKNVVDYTGNKYTLEDRMNHLFHADFFIGLGSGLSWLAWAMKKHVILISGFSKPFAEFNTRCERIINYNACNGCWNDTSHIFDKGNWNWCPRHENTQRHFECTRSISVIHIIEAIEKVKGKV
jgi:autotransporter strand-loop-strand O-heptosyltransferase